MPCGLCGSMSHNRSACPWRDTNKPSTVSLIEAHWEAEFYNTLNPPTPTMNNDDTYHDELTAHLAACEHPQPHPKRYDHGYIKYDDMRLRDFGLAAPQRKSDLKHPGPITMHERGGANCVIWVFFAAVAVVMVFAGAVIKLSEVAR